MFDNTDRNCRNSRLSRRDNNLTQFFVFVICAKIIFQNLNFLTGSFCTKIKHNKAYLILQRKKSEQKCSFLKKMVDQIIRILTHTWWFVVNYWVNPRKIIIPPGILIDQIIFSMLKIGFSIFAAINWNENEGDFCLKFCGHSSFVYLKHILM